MSQARAAQVCEPSIIGSQCNARSVLEPGHAQRPLSGIVYFCFGSIADSRNRYAGQAYIRHDGIIRGACSECRVSANTTANAIFCSRTAKIDAASQRFAFGKNKGSPPILYAAMVCCPSGDNTQSTKAWPISCFTCGWRAGFTSITPYWLNKR